MTFEIPVSTVTLEQFHTFIALPENAEGLFELINGEIVEKMPGRTSNSQISVKLVSKVIVHCETNNLPCFVSGADGAYRIGKSVIAPDMAYKRTPMSEDYPDPQPPLLAAEVISPTDEPTAVNEKIAIYIQAGILLWIVNPRHKHIYVYAPGKPMQTLTLDDSLDGDDVLPGFKLPLKAVF